MKSRRWPRNARKSERSPRVAELAYALTQDGAEVDFAVTEADGSKSLIQVAAELRDEATLTREFRPLQPSAVFRHPDAIIRPSENHRAPRVGMAVGRCMNHPG